MQNKSFLHFTVFIALFYSIFSSPLLFAKEKHEIKASDLTLDDAKESNSELNEICQPLSWESAGDVSKYEITIEKLDEETGNAKQVYFHETNEDETQKCLIHIEPVLPPGKYRFHIAVYNILGILEEELGSTDELIIRKAYMPEVKDVSYPMYMRSVIYLDDLDNNGIIEIEGKNLFEPDLSKQKLIYTDYFLKSDKRSIYPDEILSHDEKNRKLTFRFEMKKLDVGNYHFYAQDASGLHSEETLSNKLTVKFRKWADLDVEAGYVFPIVLHDGTFSEFLDTNILPLSAQAKLSFMTFKHSWGYLGFGLRATYSRLDSEFDSYSIDGNIGTGHLMFIYQLPTFRRRLFLEAHAGAGVTYFHNMYFHFSNDIDSEQYNSMSLSFIAGCAAQLYINKRFFTELAADYAITLNGETTLGMLMPAAGIGWQF